MTAAVTGPCSHFVDGWQRSCLNEAPRRTGLARRAHAEEAPVRAADAPAQEDAGDPPGRVLGGYWKGSPSRMQGSHYGGLVWAVESGQWREPRGPRFQAGAAASH